MLCCPNCFDDVYIRRIFPLYSDTEGDCELCGSKEQLLARPVFFKELFENIVDTYVPDPTGKSLVERFQEDWELFPLERIDIRTAQLLFGEILDDGNIVRQKFSLPRSTDDNISEKWDLFRYELKHQNRFFTEHKPDFETLTTLLQYIYLVPEELPSYWYRSRLSKGDILFEPSEMLAPPKDLVGNGRANPAGIPYLYVASDEVTAVSEIRPHTGESVNVAEIQLETSLKLIDLREPRKRASPLELFWVLGDIGKLHREVIFLEHLGQELSRPIQKHAADYDYVPSQYLCELIKRAGYDGVVYKSALAGGFNAALFNQDDVNVRGVKRVTVGSVTISIS